MTTQSRRPSTAKKCNECGNDLSPEEALLSAIFCKSLCTKCAKEDKINQNRCSVVGCGKPTSLTVNGQPLCGDHAYGTFSIDV